jgi:nicotinate dehydrogenase subunit A
VPEPEELSLRVNGTEAVVRAVGSEPLTQVLRRELLLFGVRETCTVGVCGACTLLVDGLDVTGCLYPVANAVGREITTVEGLGSRDDLHPVQQKFLDRQAFQCAYCTPGFVCATVALLNDAPPASIAEIRESLGGNMCRCGSYENIEQAVLELADEARSRRAG